MSFLTWKRNSNLINGQEYIGNQILAKEISDNGYEAIINEYVYIDSPQVEKTFKLIPKAWESVRGIGVDLGGGVGCISSTLAGKDSVEKIYCVELAENAVKLCHPIVKKKILKENAGKVISVIGDFDNLELDNNSIDFAVSWDSMHHSINPIKTLEECHRILKENGRFILVDRAHNNSTPDSEIERMLNIVYDKEFLIKNHRPENMILTRSENGEHEYRFYEWENFFQNARFKVLSSIIIKTATEENKKIKNDNNIREVFADYKLGGFGDRKVAFVLAPLDI
jgi:ubiquinone/menaquinone biosynthesis C-methylase UbiE